MSVTFMLPREYRAVTREDYTRAISQPCPSCGGHNMHAPVENKTDANIDCGDCYGYGGDRRAEDAYWARESDEDGEFNVANGNAIYIVQELLNLPHTEVYGGSVEPTTVLMRLAVVFDTARGVVQPSESQAVRIDANGVGLGCRVFNAGRSERQIDSYITRLRRLAEIAIERGAPEIVWG